jgi:cholesterol oxidase
MEIISRPIDKMLDHYSVVVVGSGYGGAITAARIARAGRDVCVLERGKELHPGEYPNSGPSALREIQVHTPRKTTGPRRGYSTSTSAATLPSWQAAGSVALR